MRRGSCGLWLEASGVGSAEMKSGREILAANGAFLYFSPRDATAR